METYGTVIKTNDDRATAACTNDSTHGGAPRVAAAASDVPRPATDPPAGGIQRALDRVAGTAAWATGSLEASGRQLCSAGARLTQHCGARMRDKPMSSLGIAAGAGLLLGWLLSRR